MNLTPHRAGFGDHPVLLRIGQHLLEILVALGPVDRLQAVAFDNGQPPADLAEWLIHSVTDDACDALARRGMPIQRGHEHRLTEIHAHRRVAANAEIAERAVGFLQNRPVQRGKHRAE